MAGTEGELQMIRKTLSIVFTASLAFISVLAYAQSSVPADAAPAPTPASATPAPAPATPATSAVHAAQDPGDRAYQANCARCHSAPEELSPRVSPAVVMHMRVRANLSAEDQKLILKYLAP